MKKIISILVMLCITADACFIVKYETVSENSVINKDVAPIITYISKKQSIENSIANVINPYPRLKEIVQEANINIPSINGFIPQGITLAKGHYLITGYYESHESSKCYILDALGDVVNIVELDTNSHVGSISYDEKRELLWIPDNNGILNAYDASEFFTKQIVKAKYKFDNISQELIDFQNTSNKLIAYLCINNDDLFIGNFFINTECIIKKYQISNINGKITLKYINNVIVPEKIQSIDFIEFNQKKYMLLSQSYGRYNPSYVLICEYDESKTKYYKSEFKKIKTPPLMEQISINHSSMYLLFESSAYKYWNCPEKIRFIISLNVHDLLNTI